MKVSHFAKLLLYGVLMLLSIISWTAKAADIIPITLPKDLPVSATAPYVLNLDRAVATPNGNFLAQDHVLRFDMGAISVTGGNMFVRITFTEEVLWNLDNAALLFEEGYQPNLSAGTQDLNGDGVLEVLEIGSLVEITPNRNVLIFNIGAPPTNVNANLILSTANPNYTVENGRITNTASHPTISVIDTSQPARVTYSVHSTEADAKDGTNALFTDPDILLIDFVQQFDFSITHAATSVLNPTTTPVNSLFIAEGTDPFTTDTDTSTSVSAANYLLVNNANLIEDPINLVPNDTLVLSVFGNMSTVSDVFIEFDGGGLSNAGTRSPLAIAPEVATVQFSGDTLPTTMREDKIAIEIPGGQSVLPNSYTVNAKLSLSRGNGVSDVIMDEIFSNAFRFIEQQAPIFNSQPIPNSNIDIISEFGVPTVQQITFTNQGLLPLDIQLASQPSSELEFVTSYSTQLLTGQTDTFSIQCTPSSSTGTRLNLQFTTNSPNQELINYNLLCHTEAQPEPEVEITVDGVLIESGENEINFGTISQGESSVVKMAIRNIGSDTLTLDNPVIPNGFSLGFGQTVPAQVLSIAQDEQNYTASFDLILTGSVLGEFKPVLSLVNNDRDENPYLITLSGTVERSPTEADTTDPAEPNATPTVTPAVTDGSTVVGTANNGGNTVRDITIQPNGSLSGGNLAGEIDNQGLIANLTINPDTTVEGGKLSSVVYNFGTVCNATVTTYSELIGGNICDDIQNFGTLTDVNILEDAAVTGGTLNETIFSQGTLCDVELDDNTSVIGGQINCTLTGQARAPATIAQADILQDAQLYNVCITPSVTFAEGVELRGQIQLPESYEYPDMPDYCIQPEQLTEYDERDLLGIDPEALSIFLDADLQQISADAMQGLTPDQMGFIPDTTIDALSEQQFDAIPLDSFAGLTEDNMSGFAGYLIGHFTPEHIEAMDEQAIQNVNAWGATKFLTNFDPDIVPLETAQTFLKEGWSMDENGLLTVPANTVINLSSFQLPENFPQQVSIDYDFPNFAKGFGVGGRGIPILREMNAALATNNPQNIQTIQQREDGLIIMTDSGGLQRAFIPDVNGQVQLNVDAPTGVVLDESTGKLLVTTTAQQQFSFIPAPKNYFLLGDTLGEDNAARCYQQGDVLLEVEQNGRKTHVVVTFGADVNPDESNVGVYLPDDNGTNNRRNVRAPIREGRVVFSDGTSQSIYPAVLFPEIFIGLANQIEGVSNVILNVDGTFSLSFFGLSYQLQPTFGTTTMSLNVGERIAPSLVSNPDGSVAYQVQDGDLLVTTRLVITLI